MTLPSDRHGAVEDGCWRTTANAIAAMGVFEIVELHEAVEAAIKRGATGEVVAPRDDAPMVLDEAVGPGVAGLDPRMLDPRMADAQLGARRGKLPLELTAAVRQHAGLCPARTAHGGQQHVA
jgi:hypothetical protein